MGSHKLQLEIPDTLNLCVMPIVDRSVYNEDLTVVCPRLQISSPGFSVSYFVDDIVKGFSYNLTACDLKLQSLKCGTEFNDLPDRLYVITYSVSPHDKVYVTYNHLRISKALTKLRQHYCDLDLGACEPGIETRRKLRELSDLHDDLLAAKIKVEDCRKVKQGLDMYAYTWEKISKFNCAGCK
jgi:hypothetical protein